MFILRKLGLIGYIMYFILMIIYLIGQIKHMPYINLFRYLEKALQSLHTPELFFVEVLLMMGVLILGALVILVPERGEKDA